MAALKNSAEFNSEEVALVETREPTEVSLALVKRGEERVVTVHSPARELQAHIDAAMSLDWRASDGLVGSSAEKHVLTGLAIMSVTAIVGWIGLFQVALALM